jgi:hypothetical protein
MHTHSTSSRRRWLAAGLGLVACLAGYVTWAQNFLGPDIALIKPPPTTEAPVNLSGLTPLYNNGSVAFWEASTGKLYVYGGDFTTCTGVYQLTKPGQPLVRIP